MKQAGFQERILGDTIPPPVHYVHDDKFSKIEFLTYKSRHETTRRVQPGLNAHALGFLAVLLDNRRQIDIKDSLEDGSKINLTINTPILAAYVFQKGLTFSRQTYGGPLSHARE
ncbi:MAG: hypothetical protein QGH40_00080 [bacterium]|nr:hypothetical protein [bacterium]